MDYQKAIDSLYETQISEDKTEDIYIKKLIANVNIGLLEKCFNKKSKGYLFRDKSECQHYQAKIGGTIHVVSKIEDCVNLWVSTDLDEGIPELVDRHLFKQVGEPFYVLVLNAQTQLRNGYRYIKDLLLQNHNHKLTTAYDALKTQG